MLIMMMNDDTDDHHDTDQAYLRLVHGHKWFLDDVPHRYVASLFHHRSEVV